MHFIHFCPTDLNSCPTTVHDQPCYRVSWRWRLPFLSSLNIFFETGRAEGEIDGVRGGKWKFRFRRNSILQSSVFIDFFPQILRDFASGYIYDSVVNLEKFSFSPIELFSKGTEFVERHRLHLFFPLSLFLSPLIRHLSTLRFILHPPPGSLRKARDQEQGHCLGDDKHPCFGVSVSFHARSLGGRHFGRCLFNQVWRTTRSLGRLNLPPPHLLSSPQVTW